METDEDELEQGVWFNKKSSWSRGERQAYIYSDLERN